MKRIEGRKKEIKKINYDIKIKGIRKKVRTKRSGNTIRTWIRTLRLKL